ncbi:MAG TPA: phosphoribosylformylglycinamidine synthase subunit PurQ, partial [Actinomycetota bacterium]|nr:phosphoribosylformylglycinamidine synthase subunit PurQ [Actinomycetota bacterium]
MKPSVAVVQFPGSNCEQDVVHALRAEGMDAGLAWHGDERLDGADAVVLPGGFAHGDYLRTGAIARFSPVMEAVRGLASHGAAVVGICNGFQILCEAGLLPGALHRNEGLRFICDWVELEVVDTANVLTVNCAAGQRLRIPINHYEGNYVPFGEPRVALRYVDNPNGSWQSAAGIANAAGNVGGMMPHPER